MEEQEFYEGVDQSGIRSDFDRILLFLAAQDQQRSSIAYSPRDRASAGLYPPTVSAYIDEELLSDQSFLSQSSQLPVISSMQRELHFSRFDSDLIDSSSILEDIHGQEVSFQESSSAHFCSGYASSFQDNVTGCDNYRGQVKMDQTADGLQYLGQSQIVPPAPRVQDSSTSIAYSSFLPSGMFQSFNEFLVGDGGGRGDGGAGAGAGAGSSGVLANTTPNSTSLSSSCSEDVVDEESSCHPNRSSQLDNHPTVAGSGPKRKLAAEIVSSEDTLASVANNKKLQVKPHAKIKGRKRLRETRYAIQTRTEKDVLEDGYKWRKYGQKAVKNTPYPRSYYRCTYSECSVKKRVERSCEDSGLVITTYEGTHVHPSPAAEIRAFPAAAATPSQFLAESTFARQLYCDRPDFSSHDYHMNNSFELAEQITSAAAESFQLPDHQLETNLPDDIVNPSTLHMH